jgi:hypothetical protein
MSNEATPKAKSTIFGMSGVTFLLILVGLAIIGKIISSVDAPTQYTPPPAPVVDLTEWKKTPAGLLCAKHPTWKKDECDQIVEKNIWIGMGVDMLEYYYGKPDSVNRSNYGQGERYQ